MTESRTRPGWVTAALAAFALLGTVAIILAVLFVAPALLFARA